MAVVDPYSPCPCGSGQKFKWCCHKVEAYAERAQRLFEGGQQAAAIEALDEGLRKDPHNAWLLTRKALYQIQKNEPEGAKESLRRVLGKQPKHVGAQFLMTRLVLETEGAVAGAQQFQQALTAFDREEPKGLASLAQLVGAFLLEEARYPAALMHLTLEYQIGRGSISSQGASLLRMIKTNPSISPWMKNTYQLSERPGGLSADVQSRFEEAVRWAQEGLWASAAAAFELLSADATAGPEADRNLGLCRLWMGDEVAAAEAFRRFVARSGATTEAVDFAALCQEIEPPGPDDQVEQVQWIWPLRDREQLLGTLGKDPAFFGEEPGPIDPENPDSPVVDQFVMLDRPMLEARPGMKAWEIPRVVGRVLVGQEIVALETFDDGRLDALAERFTSLAGPAIAPAHPKTKVLGKTPRSSLALTWERILPEGLTRDEVKRLSLEQGLAAIREVWPNTPMPYLGGRTPLEAAEAGDAEVPLRAAVMQLEQARDSWHDDIDFGAVRAMLKIGPEPAVDPETVDLKQLHLARLSLVPIERLDDDRLVEVYVRSKASVQVDSLVRATRALIDRPSAAAKAAVEPIVLYSDLVVLAAGQGKEEEAFDWLRRGRQADPASSRARNAAVWDMVEIRLRARSEAPESWVPELAFILARYRDDPESNRTVLLALVEMRLIQLVPGSDRPDDMRMDPRPLQALLAEYGPRVTTASGHLGVAATKGEIWTPGSSTGGGAIWTPGSGPASGAARPSPGGEKPKLIIPGR
jgi:tetratricopeptide (TPR) repeat protein